jgi:hypothetical protein
MDVLAPFTTLILYTLALTFILGLAIGHALTKRKPEPTEPLPLEPEEPPEPEEDPNAWRVIKTSAVTGERS